MECPMDTAKQEREESNMIYTGQDIAQSVESAVSSGISAGLILAALVTIISLAIFCLYVAVGTWVVKKVWFSSWGGYPGRYR